MLHARSFLPEGPIVATYIGVHGYGAHINRPAYMAFCKKMQAQGIAVLFFDQPGHGYSDGERCFMEDFQHLVDDALCLVAIVEQTNNLPHTLNLGDRAGEVASAPLFIGGQSMGGCITLHSSMALRLRKQSNFKGAILLAPAIEIVLPPAALVWVLQNVLSRFLPRICMPEMFDSTTVPSDIWTNEDDLKWIVKDHWNKHPRGLGWGHPARFRSADMVLRMCTSLKEKLAEFDAPFLVIHDPEDKIVSFSGTEVLMEKSSTAPQDKTLLRWHDKKHDLLTNCPELPTTIVGWMKRRLAC